MDKIAILTCEELSELTEYDRQVAGILNDNGLQAVPVVWNDDNVDWDDYSMAIVRTTWGYHNEIEKFHLLLDKFDSKGLPVWNPAAVLRRNSHKFYLKSLGKNGIDIIPTIFIPKGTHTELDNLIKDMHWDEFIIKPAVSAGSQDTFFSNGNGINEGNDFLGELLSGRDVLLQKFMPEILTGGEISTIFFSDGFHYTINKVPRAGDFRVQNNYGGIYTHIDPAPALLETSRMIAGLYLDQCLYARIDGVESGDKFYLMEVELIEPDLYMNIFPPAINSFASLIMDKYSELA